MLGSVITIKCEHEYELYSGDDNYKIIKVALLEENETLENFDILVGDVVTIVGTLPDIEEGAEYSFTGKLIEHKKYGIQVDVLNYERAKVTSKTGLINLFSGANFEGVGKKIAERIVDTLGENAIELILEDFECLLKVNKMTFERAKKIHKQLKDMYESERYRIELVQLGLTLSQTEKLFSIYGDTALKEVKNNPYNIIRHLKKFSFKDADKIAFALGIEKDDIRRLESGVLYTLENLIYNGGHSYVLFANLQNAVRKVLVVDKKIEESKVEEVILSLAEKDKIVIELERVFLADIYYAEHEVAKKLQMLATNTTEIELSKEVGEYAKTQEDGLVFDELQKDAIIKTFSNRVTVITGSPGTGKTTIIKAIVEMFLRQYNLEKEDINEQERMIALVAPTGRAAKNMQEKTGVYASTIHRLLGADANGKYTYNKFNKLESKVLIVDEFSMVDIKLAYNLLSSLKSDLKHIIIVGDHFQIPSIGIGTILRDLVESKTLPLIKLEKVYRQVGNSNIIQIAQDVKNGVMPQNLYHKYDDFRFFKCDDTNIPKIVNQLFSKMLDKGFDEYDIQLLAPVYDGDTGINALNSFARALANPSDSKKSEINVGQQCYRVKDKVIHLTNSLEKGVMNGDIGSITHIENTKSRKIITCDYDGKSVSYDSDEFDQIRHAYCTSIHKAQGSEYKIVVLVLNDKNKYFVTRKLLYTAITRAKTYLFIVGSEHTMNYAIHNNREDGRNTMFKERLTHYKDNAKI